MHGKAVDEPSMRDAIYLVLKYVADLNTLVGDEKKLGFRPFSDRRGFAGRQKSLDKAATRWILKGMGFGKVRRQEAVTESKTSNP